MPPLTFILGNHRSGTTWLYQLLAETGLFSVLTAFHVITWGRDGASPAALGRQLTDQGITARKGDGIAVSPSLPEEYCYILNNHGFKSWLTPESLPLFSQILTVLEDGRPILLKNPWDYAHFPFLAQAFPDARFVFIHRHPFRVIQSAVGVFRAIWSRQQDGYVALLSRRYRRLWANPLTRLIFRWLGTGALGLDVRSISGGVASANQHYVEHHGILDASRRISLRYEDLCADPAGQLQRIFDFLDLGAIPALQTPPRPRASVLMPELSRQAHTLSTKMTGYFSLMGYRPDGTADPTRES
ncbi:MAG: sulfotransferase [Myxococcota bacterium]|nr:sulfotransferase [Myxococcota bacterium]